MGLKVSKTVKIEGGFPTKFINFKIHLKINGTSSINQIHSRRTFDSPAPEHQLKISELHPEELQTATRSITWPRPKA